MTGVGSSPALATCDTSHALFAGLSGGFPRVSSHLPIDLSRYECNNLERGVQLNKIKHAHNSPRFSPNVLNGLKLHVVEIPESPRFFSNYYSTTTIHADVFTVLLRIHTDADHDLIKRGES